LRSAQAYLKRKIAKREDEEPDDAVEETLEFLRHWPHYALPRYLGVLDRIQREVFTRLRITPGDYSVFAAQLESDFIDPALGALDEYGIPTQLALKIETKLRPFDGLDQVLDRLRRISVTDLRLSEFEAELVADSVRSI
jgi:hypothetical protein